MRATWQNRLRRALRQSPVVTPLIVWVAILILFSIFVPHFFSIRTISNIFNAVTMLGTVTIGVTMLMISGEFDLSVGALVAAGGYIFALNSTETGLNSPLLALALAVIIPGLLGAVNGLILIGTGMPSFIVTLGTLYLYRGLVWVASGGSLFETMKEPPIYGTLNGRFDILNDLLPKGANFRTATVWIILLVVVVQYILSRTQYGNHVFATGGNPGAARAQGVHINRVKIVNFTLSGALAGFAGVLLFSQFQSVRVATGAGVELNAIAAAVVGGTLLTGGAGSIFGGFIGVLLIQTLRSGVVLGKVIPADNFEAVVGATIVAAAILNHWIRRRA